MDKLKCDEQIMLAAYQTSKNHILFTKETIKQVMNTKEFGDAQEYLLEHCNGPKDRVQKVMDILMTHSKPSWEQVKGHTYRSPDVCVKLHAEGAEQLRSAPLAALTVEEFCKWETNGGKGREGVAVLCIHPRAPWYEKAYRPRARRNNRVADGVNCSTARDGMKAVDTKAMTPKKMEAMIQSDRPRAGWETKQERGERQLGNNAFTLD